MSYYFYHEDLGYYRFNKYKGEGERLGTVVDEDVKLKDILNPKFFDIKDTRVTYTENMINLDEVKDDELRLEELAKRVRLFDKAQDDSELTEVVEAELNRIRKEGKIEVPKDVKTLGPAMKIIEEEAQMRFDEEIQRTADLMDYFLSKPTTIFIHS